MFGSNLEKEVENVDKGEEDNCGTEGRCAKSLVLIGRERMEYIGLGFRYVKKVVRGRSDRRSKMRRGGGYVKRDCNRPMRNTINVTLG